MSGTTITFDEDTITSKRERISKSSQIDQNCKNGQKGQNGQNGQNNLYSCNSSNSQTFNNKRSFQRNSTVCDPIHQCKDLLFENSQLPVLNIIWYPDHLGRTKIEQASYLLRSGKRIIITVILLILKLGIPIWYRVNFLKFSFLGENSRFGSNTSLQVILGDFR